MTKQPILVHILFHPRSDSARSLSRFIHLQLNGDPIVPGLRVPTVFSPTTESGGPPDKLGFNFAQRNMVVLLADDQLAVDDGWCRFAADTWERQCQDATSCFVPFQLTENAYPLDARFKKLSFGRAWTHTGEEAREAHVARRVVVALCRFLSDLDVDTGGDDKAPIKLFLSHTKADIGNEPRVTAKLIESLKHDQPVEAWVDSGDIPEGSEFAKEIEAGVERTSLLAVLTDTYATREWCREEILLAKEHQRPVAVIEALNHYEARSFPYLGNVPRIRWDGDPLKGIDLLLKESLRHLHATALLAQAKRPGDITFARPPELATVVGLDHAATVLYPDPPMGVGEARRLAKAKISITTPLQRVSADRSLKGKLIALSMSESTDLGRQGLDPLHFDAGMLELSRYLLIKGATLAYGGHLGKEGYTQKLFEVVRANNGLEDAKPFELIVNHLGWPLPRPNLAKQAELKAVATTIELPRPPDIDETLDPDFVETPQFFAAEKSALHRFAWARGMSAMRAYQADRARSGVVARVALGGPFGPNVTIGKDGKPVDKWYMSRIPGVLEEILLSVQARQPVFLIGAFGGATKLVIDLIHGVERPEAAWNYQKRAPFAPEMRALYEERGLDWVDYPAIVSTLQDEGKQYINPFLSNSEREELFTTVDLSRIIELVLRGVSLA